MAIKRKSFGDSDSKPPYNLRGLVSRRMVIGEMKVGQWGWTVPWLLDAHEDGTLSLSNEDDEVFRRQGGTVSMILRRTSLTTWQVDVRYTGYYKWSIVLPGRFSERVTRLTALAPADEWGRCSTMSGPTMPLHLQSMKVGDLQPGQCGYTSPGGRNSDDTTVYKFPGATATLKITRLSNKGLSFKHVQV
jgi:hypothetical protein